MNADAEIVGLIVTALRRLGFTQFAVKINNRKLLTAIGEYAGLKVRRSATSTAASTSSTKSARTVCAKNSLRVASPAMSSPAS